MSTKLNNFAIVFNSTKSETQEVAEQLSRVLSKLGAKSSLYSGAPRDFKNHNAAATIGGDGTLLGCVPAALTAQIPLVGVNMGKLGYLTTVSKDCMEECFEKIINHKFIEVPRMVLKIEMPDGSAQYALNDLVIRSAEYRLAQIKLSVDGEAVTEYDCDGLILSTPTGSTAYNLSAGGPIVHIKSDSIVATPICAHTLTNRSLVFNSKSRLKIELGHRDCALHINVDGRTVAEGRNCLPLEVRQATRKLITLQDPKRVHFQTLREKLGWR